MLSFHRVEPVQQVLTEEWNVCGLAEICCSIPNDLLRYASNSLFYFLGLFSIDLLEVLITNLLSSLFYGALILLFLTGGVFIN